MGKYYSFRPTDHLEKTNIAQDFAYRLRSMIPYHLRVFLVGSVANLRDRVYSDIDLRIVYSPQYGDVSIFKYLVNDLAQKMYLETGVWIDAKVRENTSSIAHGRSFFNRKAIEV